MEDDCCSVGPDPSPVSLAPVKAKEYCSSLPKYKENKAKYTTKVKHNVKRIERMLHALDLKTDKFEKNRSDGPKSSFLNLFHANQEKSGMVYVNLKTYEDAKSSRNSLKSRMKKQANNEYNEFQGDEKVAMYSTNDFPRVKIELDKNIKITLSQKSSYLPQPKHKSASKQNNAAARSGRIRRHYSQEDRVTQLSNKEKYLKNKEINDKYSYKVEETSTYKKLKKFLLADQSKVHQFAMHEQNMRNFENQMNPGYKGFIRSKPFDKYKLSEDPLPMSLDDYAKKKKTKAKGKNSKKRRQKDKSSKVIQQNFSIAQNHTFGKITKRVDNFMRNSRMNQKKEKFQMSVDKPRRSYFASNYDDFHRTISSKLDNGKKSMQSTMQRPASSNFYSSKSDRIYNSALRSKLNKFQNSSTVSKRDSKTRNKYRVSLRPFTAKMHSRGSVNSKSKC
ncbi:unnamed protein product [Moneuplotes crassus]|uniref:Uncharacterized protein n=1 Tax=Euplotes crassus TaxID=5936 RepID=A0AAD1U917_EUPCR|nr:unnamed protein product [Moneuplotes crassus]